MILKGMYKELVLFEQDKQAKCPEHSTSKNLQRLPIVQYWQSIIHLDSAFAENVFLVIKKG